jgi:hypothetical protein
MRKTVIAIAALLGLSCERGGNPSLTVNQICFPPEPSDTGACQYDSTCGSYLAGRPVLDLNANNTDPSLLLPVQITNQVPPTTDTSAGRLDTAYVQVNKITFEFEGEGINLPEASSDEAVVIGSNQTQVLLIPVIPASVGQVLRGRVAVSAPGAPIYKDVTITLKAHGTLGDGTQVESQEFIVPSRICDGCLSTNPCMDPANPTFLGACPKVFQTAVYKCGPP